MGRRGGRRVSRLRDILPPVLPGSTSEDENWTENHRLFHD